MARLVDPKKLDQIKEATVKSIVQHGIDGMTISDISKNSGVSVGYLYRYYGSKEELIEDLVNHEFETIRATLMEAIDKSNDLEEFIRKYITYLFRFVAEDVSRAKLGAILIFNSYKYAFKIEKVSQFRKQIKAKLMEASKDFDDINPELDGEDLGLILTSIPFNYILQKTEEDILFFQQASNIDKVAKICCNAIKK